MAIEVEIIDLDQNIKGYVYGIHSTPYMFPGEDRVLHGWYVRKGIKIKFYYKPSWLSRFRMYWFHGWKWVDVDDKET